MNIKISYKHLESTAALEESTHQKSEKLKKYFEGKMNLDWNFTVEKLEHTAHCHLTGDHIALFAEAKTDNMYSAIDKVIAHLERQLRKEKEIVRNRKATPRSTRVVA